MRLLQLRYFLEVSQCMNITKAAKNLHISQPSLTVAIKELEAELGVNLFQRIRQRIHLTEEGTFFYQNLSYTIAELDQLVHVVKDMGQKKNLVRIGIPPMMGSFLFAKIFLNFKTANPEVKVEIVEHGALQVQQDLLNELLDLTMVIQESIINDSISFKPLMKCRLVLCVNPLHHLAFKKSINIADLESEPLILFDKGFYITSAITEAFTQRNITPTIVLETNQINTIKRFVQENLAASILIENCITPQDNCVIIPICDFKEITIGLGWKRHRLLTSDTITMMDIFDKIFSVS